MNYNAQGVNTHEILITLSTQVKEAILHIHYDQVDNKNHKSLNTLVHFLEESGYGDISKIVEEEKPFILFDKPLVAIKVNDFINEHSAAISSNVTYKGVQNKEAIDLIHKEYPTPKEKRGNQHIAVKK